MAKSKILKEIVNNEITIEVALKRLYVIANDLDDADLITWVEKELYGYDDADAVPDYRNIGGGTILYSGIKGTMMCNMKLQNCPLPFQVIPKALQEMLMDNFRRESIATKKKKQIRQERLLIIYQTLFLILMLGWQSFNYIELIRKMFLGRL